MLACTVAHQENAENDIHLDVYGLLTDGVRYFFIRLDAKANRFRVEANDKAEFNNGRFDDSIIVSEYTVLPSIFVN